MVYTNVYVKQIGVLLWSNGIYASWHEPFPHQCHHKTLVHLAKLGRLQGIGQYLPLLIPITSFMNSLFHFDPYLAGCLLCRPANVIWCTFFFCTVISRTNIFIRPEEVNWFSVKRWQIICCCHVNSFIVVFYSIQRSRCTTCGWCSIWQSLGGRIQMLQCRRRCRYFVERLFLVLSFFIDFVFAIFAASWLNNVVVGKHGSGFLKVRGRKIPISVRNSIICGQACATLGGWWWRMSNISDLISSLKCWKWNVEDFCVLIIPSMILMIHIF